MTVLYRALLVLTVVAISAMAFRPTLLENSLNNRILSSSDVLLLKTNKQRSFSLDMSSTAKYYWDVPTVPLPMRIEVNSDNSDAYMICYNPEVGDYDQDVLGTCQDVKAGGFGTVRLSASLLRKWHGKNLRIYIQMSTTNPSSSTMTSTVVIKRDIKKSVSIGVGVGVGVGGAALLGAVVCAIKKCKKSNTSQDKDKNEKNKNDKNNKDDKNKKEEKEEEKKKKEKKRKNSQDDSDQEPETSTPNKCTNCHCHKKSSTEHLSDKELEFYFPSRRFDTFANSSSQLSCSVCSSDFKRDSQCRQLLCGHVFHTSCIDNEVRRNNRCPSCQSVLTREAIQSVVMYRYNEQKRNNTQGHDDQEVLRTGDLLLAVKHR